MHDEKCGIQQHAIGTSLYSLPSARVVLVGQPSGGSESVVGCEGQTECSKLFRALMFILLC